MKHLLQPWPLGPDSRIWFAAGGVFVLLLVVLALVDPAISLWGQGLPPVVIDAFAIVSRLGESDYILIPALVFWLVSAALAALISRPVPRRALWQMSGIWAFVFIGVGLPSLVTTILKRLVGRARPELYDSVGAFDFTAFPWLDWTYQSFPSGHATTAFSFCFVLSFLAPRWHVALVVLALLIVFSRIVLGAHYPTDLLAGTVIGILGAYGVRNVFARRGLVFRQRPDGAIRARELSAVNRLIRGFGRRV